MTPITCQNCGRILDESSSLCHPCGNVADENAGKFDRIVSGASRLGKSLAGPALAMFLVVFLFATMKLALTLGNPFSIPKFSNTHPKSRVEIGELNRQEIERQFSGRLQGILDKYSLATKGYEILLGWISAIPKEHREEFVSGLERFVADGFAFAKSHDSKPDAPELTGQYHQMFNESLETEVEAKAKSALLFVVCIIIPIVFQIEKNTRAINVSRCHAAPRFMNGIGVVVALLVTTILIALVAGRVKAATFGVRPVVELPQTRADTLYNPHWLFDSDIWNCLDS